MELSIVPMWHESTSLQEKDRELFRDVGEHILEDDIFRGIFDSYELLDNIKIPALRKLNEKIKKPIIRRVLDSIKFYFNDSPVEAPYGDDLFGRYTVRYMEEVAKEMNWDKLDTRVLAFTNVPLAFDKSGIMRTDFRVFPPRHGGAISEKTALVSVAPFGYDSFKIYKEAKHELGHTFGVNYCVVEECIMNHTEELDKRNTLYCPSCRDIVLSNYRE